MVSVAAPALIVTAPAMTTPASLNVTVPVGVVPDPVIVAVKVTDCPKVDDVGVGDTMTVGVSVFTVCVSPLPVLEWMGLVHAFAGGART